MAFILTRACRRLLKMKFAKAFAHFDISSAIGKNGSGKGCKLSGVERISIGADCFLGEGTELVALGNHLIKSSTHISPSAIMCAV